MRKISQNLKVLIMALFALIGQFAIAQGPEVNLEKYWRYRYRLNSNFLIQGTARGEGFPFSSLKLSQIWTSGSVYFGIIGGDATLHNGFYFGMLATEWKLLHDQGLNTSETEPAWYYAIEAYNRLDYPANVLMGLQPDVGYRNLCNLNFSPTGLILN
jgi:hypothetical protein